MKVMTILGTRPEIIRLSLIIGKLDQLADKHVLVHTGQNYTSSLSDVFFQQLRVRQPDYVLQLQSHTFGEQVGQMFTEIGAIIQSEAPDRILVLGDTNSALCAIIAERLGIPVFHMEAGNRCYDTAVPEEKNRRVIDAISSFNLPYTLLSRENLLREGMAPQRIWVSGNPIYEVMKAYEADIEQSAVLDTLQLTSKQYIAVTAHRAENVDNEARLRHIFGGLERIANQQQVPVICSLHPRTKERLQQFSISYDAKAIRLCEPFGFFDFVKLQKHALCVVTDSGTVQEESCILGVPAVTIRNSTERPETVMCGSNVLSGLDAEQIAACVQLMIQGKRLWRLPEGYGDLNVSDKVVNMIIGGVTYV